MNERMRDVSLIRRNSYKNFVLDLYKSNYNIYENDKIGMEELIGYNLSKIDMSLISIVFPEDVDLIHVKDNEFTTSVIKTICESSGVLKFTNDIDLPLNLLKSQIYYYKNTLYFPPNVFYAYIISLPEEKNKI